MGARVGTNADQKSVRQYPESQKGHLLDRPMVSLAPSAADDPAEAAAWTAIERRIKLNLEDGENKTRPIELENS